MHGACGYTRISSDEQRKDNTAASIEEQQRIIERYAADNDYTITAWFSDPDRSGADADRPGLLEMLDRLSEFDAVVFATQDRLARHGPIWEQFVSRTDKLDVRRISVRESWVGGDTAQERETEGMSSARASVQRWDYSANVRRGKDDHAARGILPSGNPPIGYRSKGKVFNDQGHVVRLGWEIVEDEADVVRRIYRDYLEAKGKGTIARELQSEGVPTPSGRGRWSDMSVHNILTNGIYAGIVQWGKRRKPNPDATTTKKADPDTWVVTEADTDFHPPIIDRAMWDQVAYQIVRRSKNGKAAGTFGVFTGCITCGHCGSPMSQKSWETKRGRTFVYRCDGATRFGASVCPGGQKQVAERDVMDFVVRELNAAIAGDSIPKVRRPSSNERAASLQRGIDDLDDQIARAMNLHVVDGAPIDEVAKIVKRLTTQRDRKQVELAGLVPDERQWVEAMRRAFDEWLSESGIAQRKAPSNPAHNADLPPAENERLIEVKVSPLGALGTPRKRDALESQMEAYRDAYSDGIVMVAPVDRDAWRGAVHRHIDDIVIENREPVSVRWLL